MVILYLLNLYTNYHEALKKVHVTENGSQDVFDTESHYYKSYVTALIIFIVKC